MTGERPPRRDLREPAGPAGFTAVVLTYNEERSLPHCLASLEGVCDDVHVLDSGSADGTLAAAEAGGAAVHSNPFTGFGDQRNWAIDNVPHRHPWVLHLDADERLTPALAAELRRTLAADPAEAGFYLASKLLLGGRWLRHAGGYPTYQVRLFHRGRLRFENHGHGQREVTDGELGTLHEPYLHDAFAKGLDDWFAKHARYARAEAEKSFVDGRVDWPGLLSGDGVRRRRAAKSLSLRLPARPTLRMLHVLVVKRGVLDGRAGWTYASMLAAYEAMTAAHLRRLRAGLDL